jgi:protein-disulfide isomerase
LPQGAEVEEADANLRVLYKEFPILGAGSQFAARAALAAHKQGKYLPFHTALMQAQEQLDDLNVMKIAQAAYAETMALLLDDPGRRRWIGRHARHAIEVA